MLEQILSAIVAVAALAAALLWGRSARRLAKAWRRLDSGVGDEAGRLAQAAFDRELHTTVLYLTVAATAATGAIAGGRAAAYVAPLVVAPVVLTLRHRRAFGDEARLVESRRRLEQRALEVLSQEHLAPKKWAARLAPEVLPEFEGFEVAASYEAGTGMMAGDFYDLFRTGPHRLVAVIGDVTGHGIDPSITAFQTKYLLRVFLQQFRDPGQALQELNAQLTQLGRPDELVSMAVAVCDTHAGTLRYASAGHPPVWLWHEREARPLRATGPLLTLDPGSDYASREIPLDPDDVLVMYTDGLSEARSGDQLFGEDRIGQLLRKDPTAPVSELVGGLLDAAREFADEELNDDVAILALRRL